MHLPISIFLALKYLRPKRTFLSAVTVISVLGVTLGVAVLIVVLSVMTGFDDMWRDKILAFNAHITIQGFGNGLIEDERSMLDALDRAPGVAGAAPYVQGPCIIAVGQRIEPSLVRGVDAARERTVSKVPDFMVPGRGTFSVEEGEAVLGSDLAQRIGVRVGDSLLLKSPAALFADMNEEYHLPHEVTVAGIFELGMWDFDVGFVLTSIDTARDLFLIDNGVHGIQVMTDDPLRVSETRKAVQDAAGPALMVRTWEELNRPLFATLQVEKNIMFMLLLCITLVAAFSICNTLITVVVQKTREIGLLKAVGYAPGNILRVFLWQGWIQGLIGTAAGIVSGLLVLRYRNDVLGLLNRRLDYELLPKEFYHLSQIPATTSVSDIVLVSLCVMIICTAAALIPAYRAARLDPAKALRYE